MLVEGLVARRPDFRAAQLVYGDLLLAKSGPIDSLGNTGHGASSALSALKDELTARLEHVQSVRADGGLPRELIQLSSDQSQVLVVDVSDSRLFWFEHRDGEARLHADYHVSSGKMGAMKPIVLIVDLMVVRKEENHLEERFGEEYRQYKSKVRRWV